MAQVDFWAPRIAMTLPRRHILWYVTCWGKVVLIVQPIGSISGRVQTPHDEWSLYIPSSIFPNLVIDVVDA
jgi:hypothetical protein